MAYNLSFVLILLTLSGGSVKDRDQIQAGRQNQFETVYGAKGVVTFISSEKNNNKAIVLLNSNGTTFATISLAKSFIQFGQYKFGLSGADLGNAALDKKYHFHPHEFSPDYGLIQFAYKTITKGVAEVYIDKAKTTTKYMALNPALFSVQSWKELLMSAVVEVDNIKNPLREKPDDLATTKRFTVSDDVSFHINRFEGSWVYVTCIDFCDSPCTKKYKGWLKWTNGKQPLLTLYYTC